MRRILPFLSLVVSIAARKDSDISSLTTPTSTTESTLPSVDLQSFLRETEEDKSIAKLIFTIPYNDVYYNTNVTVGDDNLQLRLDLTQPEIWVMNENFYSCDQVFSFYAAEFESYGSNIPDLATNDPLYTATACAEGGVYTTPSLDMPTPTIPGLSNGQTYTIPNLSIIDAEGKFETENISFVLGSNQKLTLPDFSFVNVDSTNMWVGGLGLAGNPTGSGFLDSLVQQGIIKSSAYSLWFNGVSEPGGLCELLLGAVDQHYYEGDFYSFDIIPYAGGKSNDYTDQLLQGLKLPTILLSDLRVRNENSKEEISLFSALDSVPVLMESRTLYNYLPLDSIINLAIQLDAIYNNDVAEWIVECDKIYGANALLLFSFGDLEIDIPMEEMISNATYQDTFLTFSNGKRACYLMVLPSSQHGYSSLGITFLRHVYMALDNDGGRIAIAKANSLDVVQDDYSTSKSVSDLPTNTMANITASTISRISSGKIPFATHQNQSSTSLTYSAANSGTQDIPERFTGAVILSGQIFLTPLTGSSAIASAADELTAKMKSGGSSKYTFVTIRSMKTEIQIIMTIIGVVIMTLILI